MAKVKLPTLFKDRVLIMKQLILCFFVSAIFSAAAEDLHAEPYYVGAKGCSCHRAEIAEWERSKHARAFKLLEPGTYKGSKKKAKLDPLKDYTKEKECIKCHVTGYQKEGGFKTLNSTPDLAVIGCEMCHGPGSEYRNLHKKKGSSFTREEAMALGQIYSSLDNSICRSCHSHKDSPFQPEIDEKYNIDVDGAIAEARSFHQITKSRRKAGLEQ